MRVWISRVVVPLGEPLLLRPRLRTAPRVIAQEGGRPHAGPPATMSRLDLRFHGIEVEAGASLHRRVLDGRHAGVFLGVRMSAPPVTHAPAVARGGSRARARASRAPRSAPAPPPAARRDPVPRGRP